MSTGLASPNQSKARVGRIRDEARSVALNAEGQAPEWVMLWPQGRLVVGRDRRSFVIHDPEAIIAATKPRLPLLVDYEHDYELRKPGDETPAAGWIEELQVRDGSIWGRVRWAERAMNAIAGLEYRFLSPVYLYRAGTDPMEIAMIDGAGLTHRPNLDLVALNHEQDLTMNPDLLKALGLPETADLAAALNAVSAMKTPALERFIPRDQYDAMESRALNAEQKLKSREAEEAKAAAAKLVDDAIAAGKIAPASRESFLELASNSREAVEKFIASAPAVLPVGEDTGRAKGDPAAGGQDALTESQKALCAQLGLTEEAFLKARG
jgi:phage I-like protein